MQHHKYSLSEIENMMPWEREIYTKLLLQWLEDEKTAERQAKADGRRFSLQAVRRPKSKGVCTDKAEAWLHRHVLAGRSSPGRPSPGFQQSLASRWCDAQGLQDRAQGAELVVGNPRETRTRRVEGGTQGSGYALRVR